uniref:Putative secreted peptide n=1 Tax=Anopheles braziliensis TaxID=58242 RepID=A0A2M3ZX56_9DIPT
MPIFWFSFFRNCAATLSLVRVSNALTENDSMVKGRLSGRLIGWTSCAMLASVRMGTFWSGRKHSPMCF